MKPIMKRLFDVIFSMIALIIFALPMTIIVLVIKLRERHPVVFRQDRVGKNKVLFKILKFQSMVDNVPTQTGRLLRKTGLDELPQFINVLLGEMSIVGPRALTMSDIERLGWNNSYHEIRWKQNPGITGMAQIYGGQHRKTSWFWDKFYINKNNIIIDLTIVIISFLMNICGKTIIRKLVFHKNSLK
jgi:lipopolysaccharide/colanic/teichoic acid biosynthesis glycosyltransferase